MLKIGIKGYCEKTVDENNIATAAASGELPVFATPMMIALMEECSDCMVREFLDEGCATVGTAVNITHVSATPIGMKVHVESELIEIEGRKLVFKVQAYDECGLIGEGIHERFIIKSESFMKKTLAKKEKI